MNRLIQSRKKQLNQLKHILRLQDLLTEYDRQNAFLNLQVKQLLKQNQILKNSMTNSNILNGNATEYNPKYKELSSNNQKFYNTNKETNAFSTQRKQKSIIKQKNSQRKRYNYHFDDYQMKSAFKDKILTKGINKNSQKKDQETKKFQKKLESQFKQQINSSSNTLKNQNKQLSRSNSRSKSRSGSKKKIQMKQEQVSKDKQAQYQSRLIQEGQVNNKNLPQTQEKSVNRSPYLIQDDIFLHSFGQNQSKVKFNEPAHSQIKNQSEKPQESSFKIQNMLHSSVKRIQTFKQQQKMLKTQNKLETTQRSSILKSSQKRKNHSLNPSPKISLTTSKKFVAVQPFTTETEAIKSQKIIQRIQTIQSSQLQFPKNKQKKRRFLTVTSSSKDKRKN